MSDHALLKPFLVFVNLPSEIDFPAKLLANLPGALIAPWTEKNVTGLVYEIFYVVTLAVKTINLSETFLPYDLSPEGIEREAISTVTGKP